MSPDRSYWRRLGAFIVLAAVMGVAANVCLLIAGYGLAAIGAGVFCWAGGIATICVMAVVFSGRDR